MQKVLTAAEMREVDRLTTEEYGIPAIILMENAAHAVSKVIGEKLGGSVKGKSFLILCGKGNNGGDGAALARILWDQGGKVNVFLFGKVEETKGDARTNFEICRQHDDLGEIYPGSKQGLKYFYFNEVDSVDEFHARIRSIREDVCVDALFGTGLNRQVEGDLGRLIRNLNHWQPRGRSSLIVSIDVPSGLDTDASDLFGGDIFNGVQPDITVTFTAPKPALVLPPAFRQTKELVVADIGSPESLVIDSPSKLFAAEPRDAWSWLVSTRFTEESYKNKRGHALLIAGSENYSGAAVLCGNAAIRSGVGLVTIGTPRSSKDSIAARVLPEVMVRPLAETDNGAVSEEAIAEVEGFLKNVDAVAIGSGVSADDSTGRLVRHFVENRRIPTVLDADALTLLSPFDGEAEKGERKSPLILTPHQGEFLRMLGTDDKDSIKDRVAAVRDFAQKHNVILVLKGERVLIGESGGKVVVNPTGNSGLGKAGNGDTLTGIITGFVAQTMQTEHFKINFDFGVDKIVDRVFEAVVAAVYVAGLAGDIAEKKFGRRVMTASDVRECLVEAFESVSMVQAPG